jgi:hypothetical protein
MSNQVSATKSLRAASRTVGGQDSTERPRFVTRVSDKLSLLRAPANESVPASLEPKDTKPVQPSMCFWGAFVK